MLILGSALFYSLATVRLSMLASGFQALPLAAAKSCTLAALSCGWMLITVAYQVIMRLQAPGGGVP